MNKTLILVFWIVSFCKVSQCQSEIISGSTVFRGECTSGDVSLKYIATVKYSATLFGGVKINANITKFDIIGFSYKGSFPSNNVFDRLNLEYPISIKNGQYDVITDIQFSSSLFSVVKASDQKFYSIGWGSIDEYIYLKNEDIKKIKKEFSINKENYKDFFKLKIKFSNIRIDKFIIKTVTDIKSEMDRENK